VKFSIEISSFSCPWIRIWDPDSQYGSGSTKLLNQMQSGSTTLRGRASDWGIKNSSRYRTGTSWFKWHDPKVLYNRVVDPDPHWIRIQWLCKSGLSRNSESGSTTQLYNILFSICLAWFRCKKTSPAQLPLCLKVSKEVFSYYNTVNIYLLVICVWSSCLITSTAGMDGGVESYKH
jgi:hypothetical protein